MTSWDIPSQTYSWGTPIRSRLLSSLTSLSVSSWVLVESSGSRPNKMWKYVVRSATLRPISPGTSRLFTMEHNGFHIFFKKGLTIALPAALWLVSIFLLCTGTGYRVSEPEPRYLAGAGAVTLDRLWLHLKYFFNNSRKLNGT